MDVNITIQIYISTCSATTGNGDLFLVSKNYLGPVYMAPLPDTFLCG
jgi:hypothetical protein